MPDGMITWCDPATGEAEVARAGRRYASSVADIEPVARRAGARVHFDVARTDGSERARNVRLRAGTRVSHHQHRFGTLVGAHRLDTKGPAPAAALHPGLRAPEAHPLEVARAWATSLAAGDADGALSLYAPDARVHEAGAEVAGRGALTVWLAASPLFGSRRYARVRGEGEGVLVWWEPGGADEPGLEVRCRIAHGEVAEQWAELVPASGGAVVEAPAGGVPVALVAKGDVGDQAKAQVRAEVVRALRRLDEPVLFARATLTVEPDPARERPAVAGATLDVDGDLVRAEVAAPTFPEAIDRLGKRLVDRLEHRARQRERLHRSAGLAEPGEWRHGDLATERPPFFDRPVEERQLVRHKTFAIGELTPDEAAFDLELLGYDFYLFTDLATGLDAVLERTTEGSFRLVRLEPSDAGVEPAAEAIEVVDHPVPVLTLAEAIERLDAGREPHVFFASAVSGRGNVLYRRYDGHYGLITPG